MRRQSRLIIALMALGLASCSVGQNAHLDTTIRFERPDHSPVEGSEIYVWETFGELETIGEILRTDENGEIKLAGYYCVPVRVSYSFRRDMVLHQDDASAYHTVVVPQRGEEIQEKTQTDPAETESNPFFRIKTPEDRRSPLLC